MLGIPTGAARTLGCDGWAKCGFGGGMKRGPRSGLKAKGMCVEFCGSVLTGGDGIAGARFNDGAGMERDGGPDVGAARPGPRFTGDASPGLGGGVPRMGADMPCPGIAEDAEPGLGGGTGMAMNLLCSDVTGDSGPRFWDVIGPGEVETPAGGSVMDTEVPAVGASGSCVNSGTGGMALVCCVVAVGKAASDGAVSVLGLAVVVVVAAVETAVDGLSVFGLVATVVVAAETAVDGLFLFGFSSIDTNLPIFFS